jgi:hypothetical protein
VVVAVGFDGGVVAELGDHGVDDGGDRGLVDAGPGSDGGDPHHLRWGVGFVVAEHDEVPGGQVADGTAVVPGRHGLDVGPAAGVDERGDDPGETVSRLDLTCTPSGCGRRVAPLSVAETLRPVSLRLQALMHVQMHPPAAARPTAGAVGARKSAHVVHWADVADEAFDIALARVSSDEWL